MKFIVIEGLDGSGKSTQVKRLGEYLRAKGLPCITTYNPSSNKIGELARTATHGEFSLEVETFALLFSADLFQHYHEVIEPALSRGDYVICDRYYYSNIAYQGVDSAAIERIISYNQAVMSQKKPDAVIYLDVPPEECMRRIIANRSETSIFEAPDKLKIQRERFFTGFSRLKDTENIIIIEAPETDENIVFDKIMNKIAPLRSI